MYGKNQYYLLGRKSLTIQNQDFTQVKTLSVPSLSYASSSVLHQNNLFFSASDKVFRLKLSNTGDSIINHSQITFPRQTYSNFNFHKLKNKLIIINAYGIFEANPAKNYQVNEITQQVANLPKDNVGNYNVYFTFAHFIKTNRILTSPVYIGINNGKNLPLILKKDKQGKWYANRTPFKRLDKLLLLDLVKNPRDNYEFITKDHIIEYDPNREFKANYAFKSYVREVMVKVTQTDTTEAKQIRTSLVDSTIYASHTHTNSPLELNYQYKSLSFTYASDSWAAHKRNEYSYQLVGQDDTWSNWGKAQKKEYTNLREGTYIFQVRCRNVYGTISSVATYTFTILPPWYRTWWAYLLYGLVGIGLLTGGSVGYSRFRNRQIRIRNQELEQVVTKRTAEIRTQQQALKTTNEELVKANQRIQEERDEKVKIYLQEATDATARLKELRQTLSTKGAATMDKMLGQEINTTSEFVILRDKVRHEFPGFAEQIDQALTNKKITKLVWQIGHCLKVGMTPTDVAGILPTTSRSVSTQGYNLRKMGILEAVKKRPG